MALGEPQASGAIGTVPEIPGARGLAWAALALAVLAGAAPPLGSGAFGPVSPDGRCRLGSPGAGPACACASTPG